MDKTSFQQVAEMNTAFNNPKGDFYNVDWQRVRKQCLNIVDELGELFIALGADKEMLRACVANLKHFAGNVIAEEDEVQVRDALCDIQVFAMGAQHLLGVDGDADMMAVVAGVMTRFVKDEQDLEATIAMHAAKGVTETYTEGEYPRKILKSAVDQPDAPKGKFLKSASFQDTVFPEVQSAVLKANFADLERRVLAYGADCEALTMKTAEELGASHCTGHVDYAPSTRIEAAKVDAAPCSTEPAGADYNPVDGADFWPKGAAPAPDDSEGGTLD